MVASDFRTSTAPSMESTRDSVGNLSFEILNGGRKSDAELENL